MSSIMLTDDSVAAIADCDHNESNELGLGLSPHGNFDKNPSLRVSDLKK